MTILDPIPKNELEKLSVRSRKRLLLAFPNPTVGDVCGLDEKTIKSWKGAGKGVVAELLALRQRFLADGVAPQDGDDEPGASAFSSLTEMLQALDGTGKPQVESVMRRNLGLLNVEEKCTLEACGSELGVTRERVRQIASKIEKRLFFYPRRKAFAEIEALVKDFFEVHEHAARTEELLSRVETAFGWTGTTAFSFRRLLEELDWKIVDLPEGRGWGWNEDGRFDWVAGYVPPTMTEMRRAAIKQVLTDAGYEGLTLDEIFNACTERFSELRIEVGNIRGAMNGPLDDDGTRIIPYDRGTRLNGGTRYSLNTLCLGLQPSVAMACAIASMGLKKVNDDFRSPYVIRPPAEGVKPPVLFLPAIAQHRDFSLIKVPAKTSVNAYYLDENGRAITHGAYAKLFFRALEEKGFAFPAEDLAGLLDKGWCKIHLNAYRAVLRPTHGQTDHPGRGYWRERFVFGGEEYFVSDDWEVRNKSHFDRWAVRIASLAGIPFEPYDVSGLVLND